MVPIWSMAFSKAVPAPVILINSIVSFLNAELSCAYIATVNNKANANSTFFIFLILIGCCQY